MEFGRTLQRLRERAGFSQSQLAREADIPVKTIQNWEIGRAQPRLDALPKLARALRVGVEELVKDDGTAAEEKPRRKKGK